MVKLSFKFGLPFGLPIFDLSYFFFFGHSSLHIFGSSVQTLEPYRTSNGATTANKFSPFIASAKSSNHGGPIFAKKSLPSCFEGRGAMHTENRNTWHIIAVNFERLNYYRHVSPHVIQGRAPTMFQGVSGRLRDLAEKLLGSQPCCLFSGGIVLSLFVYPPIPGQPRGPRVLPTRWPSSGRGCGPKGPPSPVSTGATWRTFPPPPSPRSPSLLSRHCRTHKSVYCKDTSL